MRAYRTLLIVLLLGYHAILSSLTLLVLGRSRARPHLLRYVHQRSRTALALLNIKLEVKGLEHWPSGSVLLVANHMSYLDAVILASIKPLAFVTSVEMRDAMGLGYLTKIGGCLYVERRSKENIQNEIREIADALKEGTSVVVFPEATSTDGTKVLPFKRPLFHGAVLSERPVLPAVIQYEKIGSESVNTRNRDQLCWYGSMDFIPHFLGLVGVPSVEIQVEILPSLPVQRESTRDTLMEQAQKAIHGRYKPIGD